MLHFIIDYENGIMTLHQYACAMLPEQGESKMNYVFELSKEQYEKIAVYAEQREQTPEDLFHMWVDEVIQQIETSHATEIEEETDEPGDEPVDEEALRAEHPLLQIEGILSIGEPGWADRHDEYFAEAYMDDHAEK